MDVDRSPLLGRSRRRRPDHAARGAGDRDVAPADKGGYAAYYDELLPRLRPNGVLLVDNTLWGARVLEPAADGDSDTAALRAFNDMVVADDRVESYILPIADGLTVIRKR